MDKTKKRNLIIASIIAIVGLYFFVYKPYFTAEGKVDREVKRETRLEKKVLYYACALPESHKYYRMLKGECTKLKQMAEYYGSQQDDCIPNYMGGCD